MGLWREVCGGRSTLQMILEKPSDSASLSGRLTFLQIRAARLLSKPDKTFRLQMVNAVTFFEIVLLIHSALQY